GAPVVRGQLLAAVPGRVHAGRAADPGAAPGAGGVGADDEPGVPRCDPAGRPDADRDGAGAAARDRAEPGPSAELALRGRSARAAAFAVGPRYRVEHEHEHVHEHGAAFVAMLPS